MGRQPGLLSRLSGGLDEREWLQPLNETMGGQLNAPLLHLLLEEGVGEQGDPVEQEHGRDAFVLVEVEGRQLQISRLSPQFAAQRPM